MKQTRTKALSLLLAISMLLAVLPAGLFGVIADSIVALAEDPVIIIAGSDFQAPGGHTTGAGYVKNILNQIKKDYSSVDNFLFMGDYDFDTHNDRNETNTGITTLMGAVQDVYSNINYNNTILVQGNHDYMDSKLTPSGENDTDNYGVYVIHEDEYMDLNSTESTIKTAGEGLAAYLEQKVADKYDKPIYVVSHLPLHFGSRTIRNGDGKFAHYLFDPINEAGAQGLNIVYMFGHDHAYGYDNYLGGHAIYLPAGDKINIAESGSQSKFTEETLHFTYMNAGYVGYYSDTSTNVQDENLLTMTVFEIYEGKIVVKRYNNDGEYKLKNAGIKNGVYDNESLNYSANTTEYASGQTVKLNKWYTHAGTGVSVAAPGITGLDVTEQTVDEIPENYSAYLTYDITPKDFEQGDTASVTIPVPTDGSFILDRFVWVIDETERVAVRKDIVNGAVTFTTNHFSPYSLAQTALVDYNSATGELPSYTVATSPSDRLTNGYMYMIVPANGNSQLTLTNRENDGGLLLEGTVSASNPNVWYYTSGNLRYGSSTGPYLRVYQSGANVSAVTSNLATTQNHGNYFSICYNASGNNQDYYLNRWNGGDSTKAAGYTSSGQSDSNSRWYFYRVQQGTPLDVELRVGPPTATVYPEQILALGSEVFVDGNEIDPDNYVITWSSDQTGVATVSEDGVVTAVAGGTATITATLTSVNDTTPNGAIRVSVTITVPDVTIDRISADPMIGTVRKNASKSANTGSTLTIAYSDGTTQTVPVTVGMLSGSNLTTKELGTYENLTITYGNKTLTGYTLEVVEGNNYPEYPDEGAVRVNKTATGIDFQSSGVAKVELSATGVPVKKGADVIIMVDTSSSMNTCIPHGTRDCNVSGCDKNTKATYRSTAFEDSLENLIAQLKADGPDGEPMDMRVAIADFNGFNINDTSSPYYIEENDMMDDQVEYAYESNVVNNAKIFTGSGKLDAAAFVDAQTLPDSFTFNYYSGTNYDYAFDAIYELGTDIKQANADNGEDRDLYVIFMSDGAPMQYNYYHAQGNSVDWSDWLMGNYTDSNLNENIHNDGHRHFYDLANGNKHRMAEAVKGSPDDTFTIIRKATTGLESVLERNTAAGDYMYDVPGLGAHMFSIAFCPANDGNTTKESMLHVISAAASEQTGSTQYFYEVDSADQLASAFTSIGNEIAYAATNARFVDQMGSAFELQLANRNYKDSDGNAQTIAPEIIVQAYDIYTSAEVGKVVNGVTVTADMIGNRKGTTTILDRVTFTSAKTAEKDGQGNTIETVTGAYSNGGTDNILIDGVINANSFWYNTTNAAVMIDVDGDGVKEYSLAPKTFYWKMGTINTTELTLSYYVYLTGSLEGKREAGSYQTNESAVLYYTNYLGNEAEKDTTSPVIAWESANISYAFYLVDENGNIVYNRTSGLVGNSFAQRIEITMPVVYKDVLLNDNGEITSLSVGSMGVLPDGYKLYDSEAVYSVEIDSNSNGSWVITKGADKVASTYVTQFGGDVAYSNELEEDTNAYDYTHTVVWFAVVWEIQTIPDSVVIDFGLPVDITVLGNDMFGDNGTLAGVGATKPDGAYTTSLNTAAFASGVSATGDTPLWTATVNGSKVRFTLNTTNGMQIPESITFAYAVRYDGTSNPGYYYGTVTVIPATTVYYEESFVQYTNSSVESTVGNGVWTQYVTVYGEDGESDEVVDGNNPANSSTTQQEDRPGEFSLSDIDANNVYGFDPAYSSFARFSLGGAKKVTVDAATGAYLKSPIASFTFTGTGFDVISLTDSDTGYIIATVYDEEGKFVTWKAVDSYYGYDYNEETQTWEVVEDSTGCIWQVPVLKFEGLPHDTYKVEIEVAYMPTLDHQADGSYSFWLDAIRIYDPAKGDATAEDAYDQDKEYTPTYMTLRDLLVTAGSLGTDVSETTDVKQGVVFIDGKVDTTSIADYKNPGPNNETYLAHGQGVAFVLKASEKPESVQIGVKLAYGNVATLKLNYADFQTVTTATDMYYEMNLDWKLVGNEYQTDTIVLSNYSDGAVISITNIKCTFEKAQNSDGSGTENESTANVASVSANVTSENSEAVVTVSEIDTSSVVVAAPSMMAIIDADVVAYSTQVMTDLYAPKPDPFAPEHLDAEWGVGGVNKNSVLTITTSTDVASITVNGEEITSYVTFPVVQMKNWKLSVTWYKVWTYSVKVTEAGTYVYDVVAYNGEGLASEPITTELTLKSFTPEYLDTNWEAGRVNKKSVLTITTSTDVDYVTVNGEKIKSYVTVPVVQMNNWKLSVSWRKVWTYSVKVTEAGTSNYDVVAYDANGLASEPVSTVLTVRGR